MDENKKKILKEIDKYTGTLVLNMFSVDRLEGFHETEEDYYYVMREVKGNIFYLSCVMNFVPLKDRLTKKEYKRLNNWFELNCNFNIKRKEKQCFAIEI